MKKLTFQEIRSVLTFLAINEAAHAPLRLRDEERERVYFMLSRAICITSSFERHKECIALAKKESGWDEDPVIPPAVIKKIIDKGFYHLDTATLSRFALSPTAIEAVRKGTMKPWAFFKPS